MLFEIENDALHLESETEDDRDSIHELVSDMQSAGISYELHGIKDHNGDLTEELLLVVYTMEHEGIIYD